MTGKNLKQKESGQVLVKGKQETEQIQRHSGPGYTEGVKKDTCWKSPYSSFGKHNQLEKKEGNICSYWRHRDFQLNRATQSDFSNSKSPQCVEATGKDCQQFNHHVGSYAVRSMTNSVPAGLNSQLQCYPCSSDMALTADHNTCEQELPIENKAMLRPNVRCQQETHKKSQEQVLHKVHTGWHAELNRSGKNSLWI